MARGKQTEKQEAKKAVTAGSARGIGTMYEEGAMFLRHAVGEAEMDGVKYELSAGASNMAMMVRSHKSGRTFVVNWQKVIENAVTVGINEE